MIMSAVEQREWSEDSDPEAKLYQASVINFFLLWSMCNEKTNCCIAFKYLPFIVQCRIVQSETLRQITWGHTCSMNSNL